MTFISLPHAGGGLDDRAQSCCLANLFPRRNRAPTLLGTPGQIGSELDDLTLNMRRRDRIRPAPPLRLDDHLAILKDQNSVAESEDGSRIHARSALKTS